LIDNGSGETSAACLAEASILSNVTAIFNSRNVGVAAALNQGVREARARGYEWALTLDQDTVAEPFLVAALRGVLGTIPPHRRVAAIGSNYYEHGTGRLFHDLGAEDAWVDAVVVMTSGSLISLPAYEAIGGFRDEFFIDMVDTDYCLRARALGFRVVLSLTPTMKHSIGRMTLHRLLWTQVTTTNHDPARRYYMMRNHAALIREYMFREPVWVLRSTLSRINRTLLMCVYETQRWSKLKATAKGAIDGFLWRFERR
jgi:rhamnosyltransferase